MTEEITVYEADQGNEITLTSQIVRDMCAIGNSNITDREAYNFIQLCKAHRLNPFIKEAYLVKYGNNATIITGKDVFTKRAARNENCEGFRAGITLLNSAGQIIDREGSSLFPQIGEVLLGGWAEVYMRGYQVPIKDTVSLAEYSTGKSGWVKMPGTMIRKVALVHALREAMPEEFTGMYSAEEMDQATSGTNQPAQRYEPPAEPPNPVQAYEVPQEPETTPEQAAQERLQQIKEGATFKDGTEERNKQTHRLHDLFVAAKGMGYDLQAFHAKMRADHGRDYPAMTADQLRACADMLEREISKMEAATEEQG